MTAVVDSGDNTINDKQASDTTTVRMIATLGTSISYCSASKKWLFRAFATSTSTKLEAGATPVAGSGSTTIRSSTARQTSPLPSTSEVSQIYNLANQLIEGTNGPPAAVTQRRIRATMDAMERQDNAKGLEKQRLRRFKMGDVYSPHDLSPAEMRKWGKRQSSKVDAFAALSINPIHEYKNYAMMSEYMTTMGRIKHSRETGLSNVNQRRISKAIRRAIGMGLMPSVHKHPEMLETEARLKNSKRMEKHKSRARTPASAPRGYQDQA